MWISQAHGYVDVVEWWLNRCVSAQVGTRRGCRVHDSSVRDVDEDLSERVRMDECEDETRGEVTSGYG